MQMFNDKKELIGNWQRASAYGAGKNYLWRI